MSIENTDRRDVHRILSTALDDPKALSDRSLERAFELLGSDAKRVRVAAAWTFGIVTAETPKRTLPYVAQIGEYLGDPETRREAARALVYIAQANPEAIERELRGMNPRLARRCRKALWGHLAPRTVVETPDSEETENGLAMGAGESDEWGWIGGGTARVYDRSAEPDRQRPPFERPVDPPAVEYDYEQYTPIEVIHRDEVAASFKVVYRTPDGGTAPGIFKRFTPPEGSGFDSAFDRRIRMWQSIDGHESILPVVDWGTEPVPWVVTAYEDVTGVAELGRNGRLDTAVWTLSNVAKALCFAHRRGVIHGGLTPGSVVRSSMFTEPEAWRFPRVTDWGYVALLCEDEGSPAVPARYLAPEQRDLRSVGIDGTTDVYGFGVLACEALIGRAPGENRGDELGVSIPTAIERRLPELEGFLRRCLAERKAERFETIEAAASAFRTVTEGIDVDD